VDVAIVRMGSKKKITISWSGGKDSALALYRILQQQDVQVIHLHTIINQETRRVGMHGIPESIIDRQAEAIGFPLVKGYLAGSEDHVAYESLIHEMYTRFASEGITHVVFGDIFLGDLRGYRERLLSHHGLAGLFPIWEVPSNVLLNEFIAAGFRTMVCAANEACFEHGILGKVIAEDFIASLPVGADPCGENGEFHTFLFDGPIFKLPVAWTLGEVVRKTYDYQVRDERGEVKQCLSVFYFQEVLPR
jgi:uncharacterized protein (TIGR00290 family)